MSGDIVEANTLRTLSVWLPAPAQEGDAQLTVIDPDGNWLAYVLLTPSETAELTDMCLAVLRDRCK
jgi:hypothetical protein